MMAQCHQYAVTERVEENAALYKKGNHQFSD